jgi:hypothetical protein
MGDGNSTLKDRQMTAVTSVMAVLLLILLLQLFLLMVAVEGGPGGGAGAPWSAALGSGLCCGAACWLIRSLPARG